MHGKVVRSLQSTLRQKLSVSPVVAILGPRQSGKTTLAAMYAEKEPSLLRLDLERPADMQKLEDPETFFSANADW